LIRAWEAAAIAEATRATMVLAAETSAQETTTEQDSAAILIKDVEDRVSLAEREAWERVLRVEAESIMMLAFAHNKVEGLV
jgi:hypothetical protein